MKKEKKLLISFYYHLLNRQIQSICFYNAVSESKIEKKQNNLILICKYKINEANDIMILYCTILSHPMLTELRQQYRRRNRHKR